MKSLLTVGVALLVASGDSALADTWVADRAHSSIEFRTSHWGIVDIIGWFEDYDIEVVMDGRRLSTAVVKARMSPGSVRMPNPDMAANLRGMFDIDAHPDIWFRSESVDSLAPDTYVISGDMTIKGVTSPTAWRVTLLGHEFLPDALPGFRASTQIERVEFGIGDRDTLPNGKPMIGEIVQVNCNVRLSYYHMEKRKLD